MYTLVLNFIAFFSLFWIIFTTFVPIINRKIRKMKRFRTILNLSLLLTVLAGGWCMTSCIKDEAPNKECDIESAWVEGSELERNFYQLADMRKENIGSRETNITFSVRSVALLPSQIAVNFKLTDGATISPASGTPQDFTKGPVTYTVTAQDGQWQRTYKVAFAEPILPKSQFSFEYVDTIEGGIFIFNHYHEFYELADNGEKHHYWASGNEGFSLSIFADAGPEQFPTYQHENGYLKKGVRLETMSTGELGKNFGKPIAAGNLFLGKFIIDEAAVKPLSATQFGVRWDREPVYVTGFYKYKPGKEFTNVDMEVVPGRVDEASIYAVFYRNVDDQGNPYFLYGYDVADLDKIADNPQVYKVARVDELPATDQWTPFVMYFEGKDAPDEMVANKDFNLAIVFSSSKSGAQFEGAIGSTLFIDEVEVFYEK